MRDAVAVTPVHHLILTRRAGIRRERLAPSVTHDVDRSRSGAATARRGSVWVSAAVASATAPGNHERDGKRSAAPAAGHAWLFCFHDASLDLDVKRHNAYQSKWPFIQQIPQT
jgi:hypothetical protein